MRLWRYCVRSREKYRETLIVEVNELYNSGS